MGRVGSAFKVGCNSHRYSFVKFYLTQQKGDCTGRMGFRYLAVIKMEARKDYPCATYALYQSL